MADESIEKRKLDHIEINLHEDVKSSQTTGFDRYRLVHQALPEIDFNRIDTSLDLFGKSLKSPFLISSMTGGVKGARIINENLARTAERMGIAMGVGSQRPMIENPAVKSSFEIRKVAPSILLFANIGAVQLNYGVNTQDVKKLIDDISADALILHLNTMQEVFQPEGQVNFSGLLTKIASLVDVLSVPVIVKEVGWGISGKLAHTLEGIGVSAVDVAGAGGTSWSQVESFRLKDPIRLRAAETFRNWGIPTVDCLTDIAANTTTMKVIASGGLTTGVDVVKALALGACLCGFAGRILKAATRSEEELELELNTLQFELKAAMFGIGARSLADIKPEVLLMR
jgi:isopentenyl-diphosphate delta-isomerase